MSGTNLQDVTMMKEDQEKFGSDEKKDILLDDELGLCSENENFDEQTDEHMKHKEIFHRTVQVRLVDNSSIIRIADNHVESRDKRTGRDRAVILSRGFAKLLGLWDNTNMYTYNANGTIKNGFGIYEYVNGDIYKGQFMNGKSHGKGMLMYRNGDTYDGEWKSGERSGFGVLKYASGAIYIGSFENNKKHGYGTMTYVSGNSYEGEFYCGKRHGKGIYSYMDGSIYRGVFDSGIGVHGVYREPLPITPQTECFSI